VSDARTGVAGADVAADPDSGCFTASVLPSAEGVRALRIGGKGRLKGEFERWLREGGYAEVAGLHLRLVESLRAAEVELLDDGSRRRWMPIVTDIARDDRGLVCRLTVPCDLPIFRGHFPGRPIVPGVMQIGWAATLSRDHGVAEGPLSGIPAAKFSRIVRPGMQLTARITAGSKSGQVQFRYTCRDAAVATGTLQFGVVRD
jgi:3-hydroxymyristoyl/3-hydroxydecanoyl-(acyl carrier protein) dehydratase